MKLETIRIVSLLQGEVMDEARRLWKLFETRYASRGVQSIDYPNLTFQGGPCRNVLALGAGLEEFAHRHRPFAPLIEGLGCFESSKVIFWSVCPTSELKEIHQRINDWIKPHGERLFDLYLPGKWVPHLTLAMNDLTDDNFRRAMDDLSEYHPRFRQTICDLHLAQVDSETGHIDIIKKAQLG